MVEDLSGGVRFFAPFRRGDVGAAGHDEAIEEFEIFGDLVGGTIAIWEDDGDSASFFDGEDIGVGGEARDPDEWCIGSRGVFGVLAKEEAETSRSEDEEEGEEGTAGHLSSEPNLAHQKSF